MKAFIHHSVLLPVECDTLLLVLLYMYYYIIVYIYIFYILYYYYYYYFSCLPSFPLGLGFRHFFPTLPLEQYSSPGGSPCTPRQMMTLAVVS